MSQAAIAAEAPHDDAYTRAIGQLYALGQELAPAPPLPDGTPAPRRKWDLAHMRTLAAALAQDGVAPQLTFPSILIAGTNGKGSTAATLAAILAAAGYKTALYTSPHLVRVNERIQILNKQPEEDAQPKKNTVILSGARSAESKDPRISLESPIIPGAPRLASETWDVNSPPDLPSESPISPGSTEIPDHTFARLFSLVDDTAATLVRTGQLPHPPSFFEVLTALAFLYFAEENVDIAVLEVGLGGRLDATNIVEPLISVITDIALDHQEYLGDTIAQITREKAGILRPNGILVTLPQHPEANQAIGEAAATLNLTAISAADFIPTQLHQPGTTARVPHVSILRHGNEDPRVPHVSILRHGNDTAQTSVSTDPRVPHVSTLRHGNDTLPSPVFPDPIPRNHYTLTLDNQPLLVDSPLPGHHQQRNLALAIATALALRNLSSYKNKTSNQKSYNIPNAAIEAGIRNTRWPGRLEFLPPNLLLDVAHNPAGAWTLRAAIAQLPESQPRTLLFSCLADKDLTEISRILFPLFDSSPEGGRSGARGSLGPDHIVLAPIPNPRAAKIEDLLAAAHALDIPAHAAPHLEAALAQARAVTPPGGIIIATGSVYLVGAIRDLVVSQIESAPDARVPHVSTLRHGNDTPDTAHPSTTPDARVPHVSTLRHGNDTPDTAHPSTTPDARVPHVSTLRHGNDTPDTAHPSTTPDARVPHVSTLRHGNDTPDTAHPSTTPDARVPHVSTLRHGNDTADTAHPSTTPDARVPHVSTLRHGNDTADTAHPSTTPDARVPHVSTLRHGNDTPDTAHPSTTPDARVPHVSTLRHGNDTADTAHPSTTPDARVPHISTLRHGNDTPDTAHPSTTPDARVPHVSTLRHGNDTADTAHPSTTPDARVPHVSTLRHGNDTADTAHPSTTPDARVPHVSTLRHGNDTADTAHPSTTPDARVPHVSTLRHGNDTADTAHPSTTPDARVPHVSTLRHGNDTPDTAHPSTTPDARVPHVSTLRHGNDTADTAHPSTTPDARVPHVSTLRHGNDTADTAHPSTAPDARVPHPSQSHRDGWDVSCPKETATGDTEPTD